MADLNPTFSQTIVSSGHTPSKKVSTPSPNILGKVTHIVYGPTLEDGVTPDPYYNDPTDLGKILFQNINSTQNRTANSFGTVPAFPIHSHIKHFPVIGELVHVIPGPSPKLNDSRGSVDYYYFPAFNLWKSNHHNSLPDLGDYSQYVNKANRNYTDNKLTNQSNNNNAPIKTEYPLGNNFPEKSNIKALEVFMGDTVLEGRWGNSIRFSSTNSVNKSKNYWSNSGNDGDPIIIIRNGQGPQLTNEGWIPTVEDINNDGSSIYLTAGQEIVIKDIQNNFSLQSFQVNLSSAANNVIELQQQLTSNSDISPLDQDSINIT